MEKLDDGELWLPSDIFPPDEPPRHHDRSFADTVSSPLHLSRQFSNIDFHDHHHRTHHKPTAYYPQPEWLGVFGPMAQYGVTAPSPNESLGLKVGPSVDQGFFNFAQTGPVFPTPYHRPPSNYATVHPPRVARQVMETKTGRIRSSRHMHGQQTNPRPATLNDLIPFQAAYGLRLGSFPRDCRSATASGTGVFIPRATSSSSLVTPRGNPSGVISTERSSPNSNTIGFGRGRLDLGGDGFYEHHQVISAEVGLPKDRH